MYDTLAIFVWRADHTICRDGGSDSNPLPESAHSDFDMTQPLGIVRSGVGDDLYSLRGRSVGKAADQGRRRPKGTICPAGCGLFAALLPAGRSGY